MDVRLSKLLSLVLRHKAPELGFNIYPGFTANICTKQAHTDGGLRTRALLCEVIYSNEDLRHYGGYVLVKDLLAHKMFKRFTEADIKRVVASNDKQRFSFKTNEKTGELMICANQGHSFDVPEPELEPISITDAYRFPTVVHGTYTRNWDQIRREGLKRMNRTHIHFAQGMPGADGVISGMRRSCQVMIFINLPAALRDGIKFFLSKNGVVLSPGDKDGILRTRYFSSVMEARSRQPIAFEKH